MNNTIGFLKPHLVGSRFDDHTIPLELLKDFAALEEMIIEMTKWQYFQDNPDRQRIPRGFIDGISLKLESIQSGSAVPHISLHMEKNSPDLFTYGYFEKSRDAIILGISAAEHNQKVTDHIPENLLGYFDRIGRSLHDDEAMEFSINGNDDQKATLNKITRKKLLLASSKVREVTDEVTLRGIISEVDQGKMTFELQLVNGLKVNSPISLQYLATVMDAFQGYRQKTKVVLRGIGKFNRFDRLQSIESIEHLSILDPLDVSARIDDFRSLKNGWIDGENGLALAEENLNWFLNQFESIFSNELPLPYVYPTEEGGLQLEWEFSEHDISVEINLETHWAEWHDYDMISKEAKTKTLNLEMLPDWGWLNKTLKSYIETCEDE